MRVGGVLLDEDKYLETVKATLAATVAELTSRYGDGTPFFNALDERMRNEFYFNALLIRAFNEYPGTRYEDGIDRFVVSGRFGRAFVAWYPSSQWARYRETPLLVAGDLRHGPLRPFLVSQGWQLSDNVNRAVPPKYVFLDDSAYQFRTFNKVKEAVENADGSVVGHVVLYDGSRNPARVPSFYRWHDKDGYSTFNDGF
jgi:hypothetical protein